MSHKTPFYEKHRQLNAKIVDFAGYRMPVSYPGGINHEHETVRNNAGVFDVSHMGEFMVDGKNAEAFLQNITINDVSTLNDGQAQYSAMCYPDGGIVDDLIVYRFNAEKYMMVVNASNLEKDFQWAESHLMSYVCLENISWDTALLAVQGPKSIKTLQKLTDTDLKNIDFYHFVEGDMAGAHMIISRTGYTGELGFELYHNPKDSEELWNAVFEAGAEFGIEAAGLGARDTLRMEMKYALYGNDIDQSTNPIEAGLSWITKIDKGDFIGRDALLAVKTEKPSRRLIAFKMTGRGIPRQGYDIMIDDEIVGSVTSGTLSPTLKTGIGLGYVKRGHTKRGTEISIKIRNRQIPARIVKPP